MIAAQSYRKPGRIAPLLAWWRRRVRNWPYLVWVAAILVVTIFYQRTAHFGHIVGSVEALEEPIAPLQTSRLLSLQVMLGQAVKAGDIVAQMDTSLLDGELAVKRAEFAEAQDTITGYQQNILQLFAQVERSLNDAESTLLAEQSRRAGLVAELQSMIEEQKTRDALFAQRLIGARDAYELRPRIAALTSELATGAEVISNHVAYVETARAQKKNLTEWLRIQPGESVSASMRAKMSARNTILRAEIQVLEQSIKTYTLRATRDGVVSRIDFAPGNVVNSATPVLTLVSEKPMHVIGFLPEIYVTQMQVGQKMMIWRNGQPNARIPATVVSIAPDIRALPGRVSTLRLQQIRGRRVVIRLDAAHDLIPGETVEIGVQTPTLVELVKRFFARRTP